MGEGGGLGWLLAQQIVHGEAGYDTWVLDPRRFTSHGNVELTALKAVEDYQNEFRFHFPQEHRPAGRLIRTTPLTPVLAAEGAHFDVVNGWERIANITPDPEFEESQTFRFNEAFDVVAAEVAAVQNAVGLTEVNGFNRFELTGTDAHDFLDRMVCGRVPRKVGNVRLGYLLNHHGMVKAEATIANLPGRRIWYGSAAASEIHDMDWLTTHLRPDEDMQIRSLTNEQTILVFAGPNARKVMSAVSRADWSAAAFPWLSVREAHIGIAPATVMSVSFSGELAYEIHVPNNQLYAAYLALREVGKDHGLRLFGSRAVESMRLEKGYLDWKTDILTEFDPFETGISRFVTIDKPDFLGKTALEASVARGPRKRLVTLDLDCTHAPSHGGASVNDGSRLVETVTSADWGHWTGKNLALAFVDPTSADVGTDLVVDVLGLPIEAKVIPPAPTTPL